MIVRFKRVNHVQISIPPGGEDDARTFYGEVLSLEEIETPEVLRERGFFWYQIGDTELHLGPEEGFKVSRGHPAYEVDDLKKLRVYFASLGVKITETAKLPDRDRFFVYDPFGNRIELIEMG